MVDAFCATWKLVDSQNFDEYMKALGKINYFLLEIRANCSVCIRVNRIYVFAYRFSL